MTLQKAMFAMLAGMCIVIGLVLLIPEADQATGVAHSKFPNSMMQGAADGDRDAPVRWLGLSFGLLQIVFFISCLLLGVRDAKKHLPAYLIAGGIYLAVFIWLVIADAGYSKGDQPTLLFGFPLPTLIMLFGITGAPILFLLYYVIYFDRWILKTDELSRFEKLLKEKREQQEVSS